MGETLKDLFKRVLDEADEPLTGREIAEKIGRTDGLNQNDRRILKDMARDGVIVIGKKAIGVVKTAYTYQRRESGK